MLYNIQTTSDEFVGYPLPDCHCSGIFRLVDLNSSLFDVRLNILLHAISRIPFTKILRLQCVPQYADRLSYFQTRCELAGIVSINIEIPMVHYIANTSTATLIIGMYCTKISGGDKCRNLEKMKRFSLWITEA